jgi:UDP-N-acetylmuramate dehydrogenase
MKKIFDSSALNINLSIGYLKRYSHMQICENVGYLVAPKSVVDLVENIRLATDLKLPIIPIGGASNILFGNCQNQFLILDQALPRTVENHDTRLIVSSNWNINALILNAAKIGLGGLECLAGIPAHIGGLIKMNAGSFGKEMATFVKKVKCITKKGEEYWLTHSEINWGYRHSSIEDFILAAELQMVPMSQNEILTKVRENIDWRRTRQPLTMPNLGCIFKNPPNLSAGKLIDDCGLKEMSIGNAKISKEHANIFINTGNATFKDMFTLIHHTQNTVKDRFGVNLDLEIEVIHS